MNELDKKAYEKAVFTNQAIEFNYPILPDKGNAVFDFEKKRNVDYFLIGYMQTGIQTIAGEKLPEYKALYAIEPLIIESEDIVEIGDIEE